jgi:hypothetical protein
MSERKSQGGEIIRIVESIQTAAWRQRDTVENTLKDLAADLKKIEAACEEMPQPADYQTHEDALDDLYFSLSEGGFKVNLMKRSQFYDDDADRFVPWMELIYEPADIDELHAEDLPHALSALRDIAGDIANLISKAEAKLKDTPHD